MSVPNEFVFSRADIGAMFRTGGIATLLVVLFLISGVFLLRGVDPRQAAEATVAVGELVTGTTVTTTTETVVPVAPVVPVGGEE